MATIVDLLSSILNPTPGQNRLVAPNANGPNYLTQTGLGPEQLARFHQMSGIGGQAAPATSMPQRAPPATGDPRQAPQPDQTRTASVGGGGGGFLDRLFGGGQRAAENQTIQWLQQQGLDQGTATMIAKSKPVLQAYLLKRSQGQEPIVINGKVVDPNTYKVIADFSDPKTPPNRPTATIDGKVVDTNTGQVIADYSKPKERPTTTIDGKLVYTDTGEVVGDYSKPDLLSPEEEEQKIRLAQAGAAKTIGTPPAGYRVVYDPAGNPVGMEAIPGGPAALEAEAAAAKSEAQVANRETSTDVIVGAAGKIRTLAKSPGATGLIGAGASYNPSSEAAELYRQVDVLKSNATIENLSAMRQASPTGGALGNVTEKEGAMLAAKTGALDPKSSYFQSQLDDYERTLLRIVHGKDAGDKIFEQTRGAKEPITRKDVQDLYKSETPPAADGGVAVAPGIRRLN